MIEGLRAGYDGSEVLKGVSLRLRRGEALLVLGRNGAGKTTLLKTIVGHLKPMGGRILLDGQDITGMLPHEIARRGVRYVPQDRGVFGRLTVEKNISLAKALSPKVVEESLNLFPELKPLMSRQAGEISGGEQQILAVARALSSNPKLLVMDEPTTGLMPPIIRRISSAVKKLCEAGASAIIVEQNPALVQELADSIALMENGEIKWAVSVENLEESKQMLRAALGINF